MTPRDAHDDASEPAGRAELEQALVRYRNILASTLDPLVIIDAAGVIQAASDSVRQVFGWTPQELVGQNVRMLMPEPHRSRHDGYLEKYRRTGQTNILGRRREFEAQRKDGTVFPVEISVSRVDVPGKSEAIFTGIIHDITERRQAADALAESERRFRVMLEGIPLVGVMLDPRGRVTFWNDCVERITGIPRDEALGEDWFDLALPADEREEVRAVFRAGIAQGGIVPHYENHIQPRHGERRLISWSNTLLHGANGAVVGVTGLGVDITEQRRSEEELARHRQHLADLVEQRTAALETTHAQLRQADRLAAIGTLAAGLGHDMNNVLLPIRSRLDALQASELSDLAREHFDAVRRLTGYLQQLADGLHLLALDPDDRAASTESTDLTSWWEQVGSLLARGLPKGVTLITDWPRDLPPLAVAPHRLTQVVLNLIVNAGEAVAADGEVRIWARPATDPRFVRLGVTDDGRGMTEEVRQRALDPFFTTKKRGLGTGLGLALVQGVARSAGGVVSIDSTAGRGTTVSLTLPAASRGGESDAARVNGARRAVVSLQDRRIASLVGTMLEVAGLEVAYDSSGAEPEADLWITDASDAALARARAFLARPGRRVAAVGLVSAAWKELGAVIIEAPDQFERVREGIAEAVQSIEDGAP